MASKINNITELFHRFHNCEMQLRQGKISACLIAFREIIEKMPAIQKTEKEKKDLHADIEVFIKHLSDHKKFQDLFGVISLSDADLETNMEFIKSMIIAQEEVIIENLKKEEAALEAQRLEIDQEKQRQIQLLQEKIQQAIARLDEDDVPAAMEIVNESEDIRDGVVLHYNEAGMQCRTNKLFDDAVMNYSRAILVSPEDENLHYNLGRAHFEAGRNEKAEDCLCRAIQINPGFKEGEAFYSYLLKLRPPPPEPAAPEKKSGGFFKKILKK